MAIPRPPKKLVTLSPVRDVEEVELALLREASKQRCTFAEIRRRAYRLLCFGDMFHGGDSSSAVNDGSVFPDSTFDQGSRVSHGDAT